MAGEACQFLMKILRIGKKETTNEPRSIIFMLSTQVAKLVSDFVLERGIVPFSLRLEE